MKELNKLQLDMLRLYARGPTTFEPTSNGQPPRMMRRLRRRGWLWISRKRTDRWQPMLYAGFVEFGAWSEDFDTECWAGLTAAGQEALEKADG